MALKRRIRSFPDRLVGQEVLYRLDAFEARLLQISKDSSQEVLHRLDAFEARLLQISKDYAMEDSERGAAISRQVDAAHAAMSQRLQLLGANIVGLGSRQDEAISSVKRLIAAPPDGGLAIDLYLSLLEKELTGTLHADRALAGNTTVPQDPVRRAVGFDWPSTAVTMIGIARLRNIRMLLERAIAENIPGDFIETGVWRGGACIYARAVFVAHHELSRRIFVADSFKGLPAPNPSTYPADANDPHAKFTELSVSRREVEDNFRRYGLLDDNVVFLEGWFKETLPSAPIEKLAVLRLDGDMYESTIQALEALYHKLAPGGFVIIDDYILENCAKAVEDFRRLRGIDTPLNAVDGAAVWWQVRAE
jgi:O-methyltransferase